MKFKIPDGLNLYPYQKQYLEWIENSWDKITPLYYKRSAKIDMRIIYLIAKIIWSSDEV